VALRFYLDEDLMPRALVQAARTRSLDILTTAEANRRGASDAEQLAFATAEGRVLVTRNLGDFAVLHALTIERGDTHSGIVAVQRRAYSTAQYLRAFGRLSAEFTSEEMANRFEFLGTWL